MFHFLPHYRMSLPAATSYMSRHEVMINENNSLNEYNNTGMASSHETESNSSSTTGSQYLQEVLGDVLADALSKGLHTLLTLGKIDFANSCLLYILHLFYYFAYLCNFLQLFATFCIFFIIYSYAISSRSTWGHFSKGLHTLLTLGKMTLQRLNEGLQKTAEKL